jgi:hypothetical protein
MTATGWKTIPGRPAPVLAGPQLAIAGKDGSFRMARPTDPAEIGRLARQLLQDPTNWRRSARSGSRDDKILWMLKTALPEALDLFPTHLLLAVAKRPKGNLCSWDSASMTAALSFQPDPAPTTPGLRALLGEPCRSCVDRHSRNVRITEVRAETPAARVAAAARYAPKRSGDTLQERERWWAGRLGIPLDQPSPPPGYRRRKVVWPDEGSQPASQAAEYNRLLDRFYEQARQARRGRPR